MWYTVSISSTRINYYAKNLLFNTTNLTIFQVDLKKCHKNFINILFDIVELVVNKTYVKN